MLNHSSIEPILTIENMHTFLFILPRYLVARENNESAAPVAFAHFRYDMDYDDEVVYVYEIQGWPTKNACPGLRESRAFCRILTGCAIRNSFTQPKDKPFCTA